MLENLRQFTGTKHWYRHGIVSDVTFTDGVKYVADHAGAYWLIDEIALAQKLNREVSIHPFQAWSLSIDQNNRAILSCEDGNHNKIFTKKIEFTDFPPPGITFWCYRKTILIPSEY